MFPLADDGSEEMDGALRHRVGYTRVVRVHGDITI